MYRSTVSNCVLEVANRSNQRGFALYHALRKSVIFPSIASASSFWNELVATTPTIDVVDHTVPTTYSGVGVIRTTSCETVSSQVKMTAPALLFAFLSMTLQEMTIADFALGSIVTPAWRSRSSTRLRSDVVSAVAACMPKLTDTDGRPRSASL